MLNRLEGLYLNILRVVIIVLATVLLVAATIGLVIAGPMLLSSFGGETNAERLVSGDNLQTYLGNGSGAQSGASSAMDTAEVEQRAAEADRRYREAATNIARYMKAKAGVEIVEPAVTDYLQGKGDQLPMGLGDKYADSVLGLSQDLVRSPATTPLVDVDQLIEWHHARFAQAADEAAQRDALKQAEAMQRRITAVAAATGAVVLFGMFLLMVFVFVLVKIERNLRLVPVLLDSRSDGVTVLARRATEPTA